MTSASFAKQKTLKKDKAEKKLDDLTKFLPAADVVFAEIQKDRDGVVEELKACIYNDAPAEELKAVLIGLRMYDQKLISLQKRLGNILRLPIKADEEQEYADL